MYGVVVPAYAPGIHVFSEHVFSEHLFPEHVFPERYYKDADGKDKPGHETPARSLTIAPGPLASRAETLQRLGS
jgi:hypothetical protein